MSVQTKIADATQALLGPMIHFMSASQRQVLLQSLRGEEKEGIADIVLAVAETIKTMPKTYDTEGQGNDAVVYLHYFLGSVDAWVTEKDKGDIADPFVQHQAFGKISLGYGAELGYISIKELIENGVELDLYWTPVAVGTVGE